MHAGGPTRAGRRVPGRPCLTLGVADFDFALIQDLRLE